MTHYILRRLLLMIPTLLGILLLNFIIVQVAPGGPIDQMLARFEGMDSNASTRLESGGETTGDTRNARGIDPRLEQQLRQQFGFDKPPVERFVDMLGDYATFDLGDSFFRGRPVVDLIVERLPVSISLGLWTTLLVYAISIPLGVRKALRHGSRFDVWTSGLVIVGYAVPGFLFAILLIVVFAGGSYLDWFPLRGLTSPDFAELSWWGKIQDYFWHIALPVLASAIGSFATLTMLTKNSFLDEIHKQYVLTARAKGASDRRVLYGHVFRNAMLIIIAGLPSALIGIFFTGSLLIEVIFSLDGLGLLGFEAVMQRDYPVIFGTLYLYTLIGLVLKLISDLTYVWVDPRIDFATREA
ncbi:MULTISPECIES: microcin C ABC transporter permease YejB [Chromohalobacter]|uniref:microcin C ABC transporter permease YejB n=1 Tax=Chromohalobacter TaxID=42054 RepID=UPI000A05AC79|nr:MULTISPECIES: microcin C ABC transporter permease YejB [Chromohalobacter]MBZ5876968.1 microcin C ABC transporter permease YejB [Chromohalobacter salexigens]MDF9434354.1 microcin C ABC transporter permease YejB [Chromohalobacter israelensis]MDO0946557.1 microcin C ABC transporter permease YejB [Chromohalobacter salexigens]NQY46732.1 microcin C ABC transporter permease YejB [Chromohalobacter sp.]NWO56701.1 microcin C ABC transporter permease YejB [Chromohalobacter salexigens]